MEVDQPYDRLCKSKPSLLLRQHHEVARDDRFHGMIPLPLVVLLLELRERLLTLGISALMWFENSSLVADEHRVSDNWPITEL